MLNKRERIKAFGHLVAPLDARYIALAHIADAPEYSFLADQEDLRLIVDGADLDLYENEAWKGSEYPLEPASPGEAPLEVFGDEQAQQAAATTLQAEDHDDGSSVLPGASVLEQDLFWKKVDSSGEIVGTDKPCGDGWLLDTHEPRCHLGAVAAFDASETEPGLLWRPHAWNQLLGLLTSLSTIALLVVLNRKTRA